MNLQEAKTKLEALRGISTVKIRVLHDVSIDIYINKEPDLLADDELPFEVIADIHCAYATLLSNETLRKIWAIVDAIEQDMKRRLSSTTADLSMPDWASS